jgi:hypothetical protein
MKTRKKNAFLFFISLFLFACATPNIFDAVKVLNRIEEKHCEAAKTHLRGSFTLAVCKAADADKHPHLRQWEETTILLNGANKDGITYQLVFKMKNDEPICIAAYKDEKPDKQLFDSFSACASPDTFDTSKVLKYIEKRCEETKTPLLKESFALSVCGAGNTTKYPHLKQWENTAILLDGVNKDGINYQLVFIIKDDEPICIAAFKGGNPDKQLFDFYR